MAKFEPENKREMFTKYSWGNIVDNIYTDEEVSGNREYIFSSIYIINIMIIDK